MHLRTHLHTHHSGDTCWPQTRRSLAPKLVCTSEYLFCLQLAAEVLAWSTQAQSSRRPSNAPAPRRVERAYKDKRCKDCADGTALKVAGKDASELGGMRVQKGRWDVCPERWAAFIPAHFVRRLRSSESTMAQRERVARLESTVAYERRDGTGSSPMSLFSDDVEATPRLRMGEGLAAMTCPPTFWPSGGRWQIQRYSACATPALRGATATPIGARGARIGTSVPSPKTRRTLLHNLLMSLAHCKRDGSLMWTAVCRSISAVVLVQLGFFAGHRPMGATEAIRTVVQRDWLGAHYPHCQLRYRTNFRPSRCFGCGGRLVDQQVWPTIGGDLRLARGV